jgi:hypothetical protein
VRRAPTPEEARRHLAAIAREPRPAGGAAERAAREHCAAALREIGFEVREAPFEYSALPGRWATPLAGALSIAALMGAGHVGYRGAPLLSLAILAAVGVPVAAGAAWLARRGVLALPWMRERSRNLVATRGAEAPRAWLVAHLDSKSQPVPIGVRALGIALTVVAWLAAAAVAALQLAGRDVSGAWPFVSAIGALAGLPVAASVVRARSPGALDDASGVATVLLAAAALAPAHPVGVLLTSAEELGLAGARAWAVGAPPAVAVNVDGVDDAGATRVMWTGRRPARLAEALLRAAAAAGEPARAARLLPGILADGVALADAGWEAVTVSRGTARTVARIHTPRDAVEAIRGEGIAATAALIAAAIPELT